jgi:hypothetical protein
MKIMKRPLAGQAVTTASVVRQKHAIEELAYAELGACGYPALRGVRCEYADGVLTLRGSVPSFYLKQVAQCLMHGQLDEMIIVDNRLEVTESSA